MKIWRTKLPPIEKLMRLHSLWYENQTIDREQAKQIRRIMEYHFLTPSDKESDSDCAYLVFRDVLNKFPHMGAFTIEERNSIPYVESELDTLRFVKGFEYINVGDIYKTTLVWDYWHHEFHVSSWGDWLELQELNGRKFV
jgi:hypothetical protein